MKKYKTVYSDSAITYWPHYVGGIGVICLVGIGFSVYLFAFLLALIGNGVTTKDFRVISIVLILFLVCFIVILVLAVRTMFLKICITHEGVFLDNKIAKKRQYILWEKVSRIYFRQDSWYGLKSYRIHFKTSASTILSSESRCDFVLPVSFLDETKVQEFIPTNLLVNKPFSV